MFQHSSNLEAAQFPLIFSVCATSLLPRVLCLLFLSGYFTTQSQRHFFPSHPHVGEREGRRDAMRERRRLHSTVDLQFSFALHSLVVLFLFAVIRAAFFSFSIFVAFFVFFSFCVILCFSGARSSVVEAVQDKRTSINDTPPTSSAASDIVGRLHITLYLFIFMITN